MLRVAELHLHFSEIIQLVPTIPKGKQVTICLLSGTNVEKSKRFFEALRQNGQVNMPFGIRTF